MDNSNYNNYLFNKYNSSKYIDPEIESLELLSIIPLHLVSMSCLRKGQRQILKISYCTKRTMYFEFGGLLLRNVCSKFCNYSECSSGIYNMFVYLFLVILEYLARSY